MKNFVKKDRTTIHLVSLWQSRIRVFVSFFFFSFDRWKLYIDTFKHCKNTVTKSIISLIHPFSKWRNVGISWIFAAQLQYSTFDEFRGVVTERRFQSSRTLLRVLKFLQFPKKGFPSALHEENTIVNRSFTLSSGPLYEIIVDNSSLSLVRLNSLLY